MPIEHEEGHNLVTLAAIGATAHIVADVVHEVVGHGGVCLLTGGKITLLTSVFFENEPRSRLVAAAGPCANLVFGGLLWLLFRSKQSWSPASRLFLVFAMAFNFFWAAGYFIYSGVADTGDWAIAFQGPPVAWPWRATFIALGLVFYFGFGRAVTRAIGQVSTINPWRLVIVPYFAAVAAACVAAMFYQRDPMGALAGAVRESVLANIVLLAVPRPRPDRQISARTVIDRDNHWLIASAILLVAFVVTLGRGVAWKI